MISPKLSVDGKCYLYTYRMSFHDGYEAHKKRLKGWNRLRFWSIPFEYQAGTFFRDVRKGIPYPDASFDLIYCYHILEHLTVEEAPAFVSEIKRILKPGGICRFSTPDLASKAMFYKKSYLAYKNEPNELNRKRYEWAKISAFEQTYRTKMGGVLLEKINQNDYDLEYTIKTTGDVVDLVKRIQAQPKKLNNIWQNKNLAILLKELYYGFLRRIWLKITSPSTVMKKTYEKEKWYYDSISLSILAHKVGFSKIVECDYKTSLFPNWENLQFDTSALGSYEMERSVYLEVIK